MGSRLGPNYACLFVGYVEERMLSSYTGIIPDLYKRYMDDVAGAASCSEEDLRHFIEFASSFHPNLEYTWSPGYLLDICMKPQGNRIATSIYITKPRIATLTSTSVHPILTAASHPYLIVSFSDYARFVVMTLTSTSSQQEWRPFSKHADIRMTSLEGEGNEHRPYQGLKF